MTCIAGIAKNGKVYIGADSVGVSDHNRSIRNDSKVFIVGEFLIGFTTSFRMGQLLQYSLKVPKKSDNMPVMEYLITVFIPKLQDCLKSGTFEGEDGGGGVFLLGYNGKLYKIWQDFQVEEPKCQYSACGSGENLALGSLYSTTSNEDCSQRIMDALNAAEAFNTNVAGPFNVLSI